MECPFLDAKNIRKKAKVLLWGGPGAGKTLTALNFPKPVIIDMERGSDLYAGSHEFKVFHTVHPDKVSDGISWLRTQKHDRETVILDSMTEFWTALQYQWVQRFQKYNHGKGNKTEYYDLQAKDWSHIKADIKEFLRSLIDLDMNVIVTARAKDLYDNKNDNFLNKIGETFDSEKSLPYLFDTVVKVSTQNGRHWCEVVKDRTCTLPAKFDLNYLTFAMAFELDGWDDLVLPDTFLWKDQRGKGLTGRMFAKNDPACDYQKGERTFRGAQILHIIAEKHEREEARTLAGKLIAKYKGERDAVKVAEKETPPEPVTTEEVPTEGNWEDAVAVEAATNDEKYNQYTAELKQAGGKATR